MVVTCGYQALNKGGVQTETDCTPVPIKDTPTPVCALVPAVSKPGTAPLSVAVETNIQA